MIQGGKATLKAAVQNTRRTTLPLEPVTKGYRRGIRSMEGFGSMQGATNFSRTGLIEEVSRSADGDWLKTLVA